MGGDEELVDDVFGMGGDMPGLLDLPGEYTHALLHRFLVPDGNLPNSTDTLLHKLRINLIQILP